MTSDVKRYSRAQIWLHWGVVGGIVLQIGFHEPIVRVMAAQGANTPSWPVDLAMAYFHAGTGALIFLAVIARLWLRFRLGVPSRSDTKPLSAEKAANFVHWTLYALLLSMVTTGILTWLNTVDLGGLHFIINVAILVLATGHACAALFNQFVIKDGTLTRMKPY